MKRDLDGLKKGPFDVLVIGGGVYGAWTAYDAALRGLKVALVEKSDWASGTSSASTKLIHGGLRYLEHLRLDLVKTSLDERKRLSNLAPHMVTPLKFLIPVYEENRVGPLFLKTGLWLYDLLAGKDQPVRGHRSVSRRKVTNQYGFLNTEALIRGFAYGDCQMDDGRFVVDVVKGAITAGAKAANYVKAESYIESSGRVVGAKVRDQEGGDTIDIHAEIVVNAAGPWGAQLEADHFISSFVRMSKGIHLILPPLPTADALLLMTSDGNRIFFMVPWYDKTLVGTTDADFTEDPDMLGVTSSEMNYLLGETNRFLKDRKWNAGSVIGAFAGLRALKNEPGKPPSQISREWSFLEPRPGVMVSVGGKYTSARADAGKMVDRILALLERPRVGASPTETLPLPSAPRGDFKEWRNQAKTLNIRAGMDRETARWAIFRFGKAVTLLRKLMEQHPQLANRLVPDLPFSRAEVVFSARNEMVRHLDDLLRRRMPITLLSRPDETAVEAAAALAAPELGWNRSDRIREMDDVLEKWHRSIPSP